MANKTEHVVQSLSNTHLFWWRFSNPHLTSDHSKLAVWLEKVTMKCPLTLSIRVLAQWKIFWSLSHSLSVLMTFLQIRGPSSVAWQKANGRKEDCGWLRGLCGPTEGQFCYFNLRVLGCCQCFHPSFPSLVRRALERNLSLCIHFL
jgi:hypothetical protein